MIKRYLNIALLVFSLCYLPLASQGQAVTLTNMTVTQRPFPSDGIVDVTHDFSWIGPSVPQSGCNPYATVYGYWVGSRGAQTYAGEYTLYSVEYSGSSGTGLINKTGNVLDLFGSPPSGITDLKFKVRIYVVGWWGLPGDTATEIWTTPEWFNIDF